jgi:hypothetical protein
MWLIEREKVGPDRGWATNHPGLGVWSHRQVEPSHGQISGRAGHTEGVNTGLKGKAVGSDWLTTQSGEAAWPSIWDSQPAALPIRALTSSSCRPVQSC